MIIQDKNDVINKDGCGRVFAGTKLNLIHAYTLECGYHSTNHFREIPNLKFLYQNKNKNKFSINNEFL